MVESSSDPERQIGPVPNGLGRTDTPSDIGKRDLIHPDEGGSIARADSISSRKPARKVVPASGHLDRVYILLGVQAEYIGVRSVRTFQQRDRMDEPL